MYHVAPFLSKQHTLTTTQGRLCSPHNQQGRWPDLQPNLFSRLTEARFERLPYPRRYIPRYSRHFTINLSRSSTSITARQQGFDRNRHPISRVIALPLDLLSDGNGHKVSALHQSRAAQHRDSRSKVPRDIWRVCHGQSVLQLGDADKS